MPHTPFTSMDASATLAAACSATGMHNQSAELLRLGENAIFRLAQESVVVRIARNPDVLKDAVKEVAVASWLCDTGLPAIEPTATTSPSSSKTSSHLLEAHSTDSGIKATVGDLAKILRQLHTSPCHPTFPCPNSISSAASPDASPHPLTSPTRNATSSNSASPSSAGTTPTSPSPCPAQRCTATLTKEPHPSPRRPGHPHRSRTIRVRPTRDRPRRHRNRAPSRLAHRRRVCEFCETYGFDVTQWDGFPVIRAINELKMTTWLMQNVRESDRVASEFRTRLRSLHDSRRAPRLAALLGWPQ